MIEHRYWFPDHRGFLPRNALLRGDCELATALDLTALVQAGPGRLARQLGRAQAGAMRAVSSAEPDEVFEEDACVMLTWHLAPDDLEGFDLVDRGTPRQ